MILVTDSAADITLAQAQRLDVRVVPLTITFPSGVCKQETAEDFDRFYTLLAQSRELPTTSQPAPQLYLEIYEEAKAKDEEVLVIALSAGLSGTCQAARMAAQLAEYDRIFVLDSRQAIQPQRMLVERAAELRQAGYSATQILAELEELRERVHVFGVLDSLVCLRKGGRIPAAAAILGDLMEIKPLICLTDGTLTMAGKTCGYKLAVRMLLQEFEQVERDTAAPVYFGYTSNRQRGEALVEEACARFGLAHAQLYQICGVIGTHLGPETVTIAYQSPNRA